jgi:hypothetical protein
VKAWGFVLAAWMSLVTQCSHASDVDDLVDCAVGNQALVDRGVNGAEYRVGPEDPLPKRVVANFLL